MCLYNLLLYGHTNKEDQIMRIGKEMRSFLRREIKAIDPQAKVFLFGSRTDNQKKGGDIDILILTDEKLPFKDLSKVRIGFYENFGEQKIDLVNFTINENDAFKKIALNSAVKL